VYAEAAPWNRNRNLVPEAVGLTSTFMSLSHKQQLFSPAAEVIEAMSYATAKDASLLPHGVKQVLNPARIEGWLEYA
jgi:hypothetical protein